MNVLMVDVGGTNVKVMVSYDDQLRKFPSGDKLTAKEMVRGVLELSAGLDFDRISLGFPGLVQNGWPAREPHNLGDGWVGFDYSKAFGKPVRCINDAAMQALGNYVSGRLLFLGFGTSIGATVIVDDIVVPIEVGLIKLSRKTRLMDRVTKARPENPRAGALDRSRCGGCRNLAKCREAGRDDSRRRERTVHRSLAGKLPLR